MAWTCGVIDCGSEFATAEQLLRHQATSHPTETCQICGDPVPAGYFAIKHAFEAHRRSEYVRAYGAEPEDIRLRERSLETVTDAIDAETIDELLEDDSAMVVETIDG